MKRKGTTKGAERVRVRRFHDARYNTKRVRVRTKYTRKRRNKRDEIRDDN